MYCLRIWILATAAFVAPEASAAPTADEIAKAIENLSDAEFETRQAATEWLWQAGEAVEEALEHAAKATDPEVRTRSAALLKKLRLGIRPDTPPEVLLLIDQFRYAQSPEQRRIALNELQAKERWQTILALIRGEQSPQERRNLATALVGQAGKFVGPLVEKGELAQAEEVLDLVATTEAGLPQLTAFLLLTGRIDKRIELAREQANEEPRDESWTRLAYLLRAKGDLSGAIEAADKTSDLILRVNLRAEAGRFSEAAPLAEEFYRRNASRLEGIAFATTFYHLAGNDAEHQRTMNGLLKAANPARLRELADKPADPFGPAINLAVNHLHTTGKTLLVNERIDEALTIMRKINPLVAYTIYLQQHRHREALELVDVTPDKKLDREWLRKLPPQMLQTSMPDDYQVRLAARVASHLRGLGQHDQVEQIWRAMRELEPMPGDRGRRAVFLMMYAWQLGRYEEAAQLATDAIAGGMLPAAIFGTLIPNEFPLAVLWHERLLTADPQIDRAKAISLSLSLVTPNPRRGGPPTNWREMIAQARESVQKLGARQKADRLVAFGRTAKICGDAELARQLFVEAAAAYPASGLHLGILSAEKGDWSGAAQQAVAAVKANPGDSLSGILLGQALEKSGEASAARQAQMQANLLLLVPEFRFDAARLLERPLFQDEAAAQYKLIARTAMPDSQIAVNAARELGKLASATQPRAAARFAELVALHLLNPTAANEADLYPTMPHSIHLLMARAAIGEGQAEVVKEELAQCQKLLPGDVGTAVDLIPALRKAGMGEIAETLFEQAISSHRPVIEQYPNSGEYLNNAAWVCARAQRELDEGLKFSLRAVELMPDQAAYQDTLAEVHFQRGEREAAIAAAQKCVDLAPANAMFAKRLKHFQEDELKTLDATEE